MPIEEFMDLSDPDDPDYNEIEVEESDGGHGDDSSESGDDGRDGGEDGDDDRDNDRESDEEEPSDVEVEANVEVGEGRQRQKKKKYTDDEIEEDIMERFEYEVEEAVSNWFDEFQILRNSIPESSDEEEDPIVTRDRKIRLGTNDNFAIGKTFLTGFEFKEAVLHHALKNRENIKQDRWEKNKISFRCAQNKECDWKLYCSYEESKQMWVLKTKCTDHNCTSNGKCKLLKSPVIGRLFMDKLRLKPNFMPLDIQGHIKEQWKVVSTIGQVQRGRHANKELLKSNVWHLAWSYNHAQYQGNLIDLRAYSMALYEDVMKEEPNTWCRPFFKIDSCCEDVDNNATESFNATIVKARAKALVPMMETIRRQAMARISKRKEKTLRWKKKISEYVSDILKKEEEDAMRCEVTKGTHGKFEVWVDGNSQAVNLTSGQWECSCCKWQVTGIPCEHAYAAVIDIGKDIEAFVVPGFSTEVWREQYETAPDPVRGQSFWMTNNYVLLKAPPEPVLPGRKKGQKKSYKRIKGKLESPKKKKKRQSEILKLGRTGRTMHCRFCGGAGHNAAGCLKFPKKKKSKKSKKSKVQSEVPPSLTDSSQAPESITQPS